MSVSNFGEIGLLTFDMSTISEKNSKEIMYLGAIEGSLRGYSYRGVLQMHLILHRPGLTG